MTDRVVKSGELRTLRPVLTSAAHRLKKRALRPFAAVIKCSSGAPSEYSVLLWECALNDVAFSVLALVMRHSFP